MYGLIVFIFMGCICVVPNEENKWQALNKEPTQGAEPNIATPCMPTISEGDNSEHALGGHTTIECDVASCGRVAKIIFEKKGIRGITQWTEVFEGVDKTHYKALTIDHNIYSLKNRHEYSTLSAHHILHIKPLTTLDQGKWRCIVYDHHSQRTESQSTTITLVSQCEPKLSEGSYGVSDLHGHITLQCDITNCTHVSKIIYEKTFLYRPTEWKSVYEGVNKTYYHALAKSVDGYSLNNRDDYAAFDTRHVLYIEPLKSNDQGNWRCVVFYSNARQAASQALEFYLAAPCTPIISPQNPGGLEIGGETTLECGIANCENVTKIIYQKTFINRTNTWTPVFEGINKTHHHPIEDSRYSLGKRTDYTAFNTRHILYIHPIVYEDQGEWRCVVYDQFDRRAQSQATDIYVATTCEPEISEHKNSKLNIGGFTTFECGIATCGMVSKILFDKTFVHLPKTFTSVYEGVNKTYQRTFNTDVDGYSLQNRTEYTAFNDRHILYIDPLVSQDEGDWRCVVYNQFNQPAFSPSLNLDMGTSCKPEILDGSQIKPKLGDHTTFQCDVSTCNKISKVQFEKSKIHSQQWEPVYEGVNKTFYQTLTNPKQGYSLKNRADYTTFKTRHILYIDTLKSEDQGEWRCVAYNQNGKPCRSEQMEFYLATPCTAMLIERSKLYNLGSTALECNFTTCDNISRVEYEKKDIHNLREWTPVYEGTNTTDNRALHNDIYSLRTRTDYTVSQTHHILYIDPLKQQDVGEWRCVVYKVYAKPALSNAMILNFTLPAIGATLQKNDVPHSILVAAGVIVFLVALVLIVVILWLCKCL